MIKLIAFDFVGVLVNENTSSIRGARLLLKYAIDGNPMEEVFQIVQDGESVDVEGFPIKWKIGVAENNLSTSIKDLSTLTYWILPLP